MSKCEQELEKLRYELAYAKLRARELKAERDQLSDDNHRLRLKVSELKSRLKRIGS